MIPAPDLKSALICAVLISMVIGAVLGIAAEHLIIWIYHHLSFNLK